MWTKKFWKAAAERAVKTFAQTELGLLILGDAGLDQVNTSWQHDLELGLLAGVISILTSIVSDKFGPNDGPSLTTETTVGTNG